MKGIKYVTDDAGARGGRSGHLAQWGEAWREFLDGLEAENEPKEPSVTWGDLKAEMEEASRPETSETNRSKSCYESYDTIQDHLETCTGY